MTDTPTAVAIIPIRGSDNEVGYGHMLKLGGKPLLSFTVEAAAQSRFIKRIIVSTDDPGVAELAVRLGAEAPFLRPAELCAPGVALAGVLQHALKWLEEQDGYHPDLVVLLEITHPLRPPGLIDRVVEVLSQEGLDSAFAAREERHEFWTFGSGGALERVQPKDEVPRHILQPLYKEMGGMVTVMRAQLTRAGRRLGDRIGLVPVRDVSSVLDLHDEDGLRLAEALLPDPTSSRAAE